MVNLCMALLWLVLGAAIFVWQHQHPGEPRLTVFGTGISLGWFGMVLALYNLARWWLMNRLAAKARFREDKERDDSLPT